MAALLDLGSHPTYPQFETELTMKNIIVITGASSGFGALAARALARAGHTVYASMRETTGRNAKQVAEVEQYPSANGVDLRAVELDVASQTSCDLAIQAIVSKHGRLDVAPSPVGRIISPTRDPRPTRHAPQNTKLVLTPVLRNRCSRASLLLFRPMPM
jgi:trans-2-enoyl-CoA reductase